MSNSFDLLSNLKKMRCSHDILRLISKDNIIQYDILLRRIK